MKHYDIIIIGSGIAGISLGSIISKERKVVMIIICWLHFQIVVINCAAIKSRWCSCLQSSYLHFRSFAFFIESYGNNAIIELTKISKKFFYDNFNLFLKKKGVMFIGNNKQKTNFRYFIWLNNVKS